MPSLETIENFIQAVEEEPHDKVIEKFYTHDASIQENQNEPRVGKENLIENEQNMLRKALVIGSKCVRPIFQAGNNVVIRWKFRFEWEDSSITEIEEIAYQEWLGYNFTDRSADMLVAVLEWADLRIPFKIEFDTVQIIIDNSMAELKGQAGFSGAGHMQLAAYCLQNNSHLDEAMVWVEQSISRNKTFSNLRVKAGLLSKKGQIVAAKTTMDEAFPLGSAGELNSYGYSLLNEGKTKEAIKIFTFNIEKHPNNQVIWMFIDSLGEAYLKDGNKKMALKYYKEAKEMLSEAKIVGSGNTFLQSKLRTLNAQILDAEGDTNGAISYLESLDSKDPALSELIGDFYIKIGEKSKASAAFTNAMKQGGHQKRLKKKIESI